MLVFYFKKCNFAFVYTLDEKCKVSNVIILGKKIKCQLS